MGKTWKVAGALIAVGLLFMAVGVFVIGSWWENYHMGEDPELWLYHEMNVACVTRGHEYIEETPFAKIGNQYYYRAGENLTIRYADIKIGLPIYGGDVLELDFTEFELEDDPALQGYEGNIYYLSYENQAIITIELPKRVIPLKKHNGKDI